MARGPGGADGPPAGENVLPHQRRRDGDGAELTLLLSGHELFLMKVGDVRLKLTPDVGRRLALACAASLPTVRAEDNLVETQHPPVRAEEQRVCLQPSVASPGPFQNTVLHQSTPNPPRSLAMCHSM